MERPRGITDITLALCVLNVVFGYLSINANAGMVIPIIFVLARFVVLWFFWNGYNWARVLVWLASVISFANLTRWHDLGLFTRIAVANQLALSVFLLWWLNRPAVRRYFDPRPITIL
jgi:hypothetical protein